MSLALGETPGDLFVALCRMSRQPLLSCSASTRTQRRGTSSSCPSCTMLKLLLTNPRCVLFSDNHWLGWIVFQPSVVFVTSTCVLAGTAGRAQAVRAAGCRTRDQECCVDTGSRQACRQSAGGILGCQPNVIAHSCISMTAVTHSQSCTYHSNLCASNAQLDTDAT